MRNHHKLLVWQEAIKLVKKIYEITSYYPKEEMYGITSQMRRAAISVPSNIAEGAARDSEAEFARFLIIARASLSELETQIIIAKELGFYQDNNISEQVEKIFALLGGLIRKLKSDK